MKKILQLLEEGFSVVALMLYTGGPLTVVVRGGASEGEADFTVAGDSVLITLVFLLIYAVTLILLALRWRKSLFIFSKSINIVLLVGIVGFSVVWSFFPSRTIQRAIALMGTTLLGIYLPIQYNDPKKFLILLCRTFGLIVVLSFLFAVVLPKYGIMGGLHSGSWRGIYYHKNALGKWMVVSSIVFLLQARSMGAKKMLSWVALGLSFVLIILSKSSAALLSLFIMLLLILLVHTLRLHYRLLTAISTTVIALTLVTSVWVSNNLNILFDFLGKDPSLTGRAELWEFVIDIASRRPWLGYGYGAFWYGEKSASEPVWKAFAWHPPNAHNGFIDLWVSIGFIGVLIFLFGFLVNTFNAVLLVRRTKTSATLLPLMLLLYTVFSNLSESGLMVQNDFFWVVYVSISYLIPKWLMQKKEDAKRILIK